LNFPVSNWSEEPDAFSLINQLPFENQVVDGRDDFSLPHMVSRNCWCQRAGPTQNDDIPPSAIFDRGKYRLGRGVTVSAIRDGEDSAIRG
jgi:hypothetical protein